MWSGIRIQNDYGSVSDRYFHMHFLVFRFHILIKFFFVFCWSYNFFLFVLVVYIWISYHNCSKEYTRWLFLSWHRDNFVCILYFHFLHLEFFYWRKIEIIGDSMLNITEEWSLESVTITLDFTQIVNFDAHDQLLFYLLNHCLFNQNAQCFVNFFLFSSVFFVL
jgi:hypothetical protein